MRLYAQYGIDDTQPGKLTSQGAQPGGTPGIEHHSRPPRHHSRGLEMASG